jgi:hypothetical protein
LSVVGALGTSHGAPAAAVGMSPSCLLSTCASSPGAACSSRRIGRPLTRSRWPAAARVAPQHPMTVEGAVPAGRRSGPDPPVGDRQLAVRRSRRTGCGPGCAGAAGPVDHPGHALLLVAPGPAGGGGVADLEPFGRPWDRPAVLNDAARQPHPTALSQRGGTVGMRASCSVLRFGRHPPSQQALTRSTSPVLCREAQTCHQHPWAEHLEGVVAALVDQSDVGERLLRALTPEADSLPSLRDAVKDLPRCPIRP